MPGSEKILEGPYSEWRPWSISSQTLSSERPGGSPEPNPSSREDAQSWDCLHLPNIPAGSVDIPKLQGQKFQSIPRRRRQREPIQANRAAAQEFQTGLAHPE